MIGTTLQNQVSRARSKTARPLALFLTLSVLSHGIYFPWEWILLGFILSGYTLLSYPYRVFRAGRRISCYGVTDALLLGMVFLSLLGLLYPVRVMDGIIEALKWGIVWLGYRLGREMAEDEAAKQELLRLIVCLAVLVAFIGWLPWVSKVEGRLSSVFGYANAAAAFLGAALLLYPRRLIIRVFLLTALLSTGSRGGVGLYIGLFGVQQYFKWLSRHTIPSISVILRQMRAKRKPLIRRWRVIGSFLVGLMGIAIVLFFNRPAWINLTAWGFTSSSWQERLVYFKDGLDLARQTGGYPRAGGWMAFATIQRVPYWTADPHSSFIHSLLDQGIFGILSLGIWGIFQLLRAWKARKSKCLEMNLQFRVGTALVFLAVHSLADVDFSFGSLGFLFWLLWGSFQEKNEYFGSSSIRQKFMQNLSGKGAQGLCLILCLICGSALLKPEVLEKEKNWNKQAVYWLDKAPDKSLEIWNRSLDWDQTQSGIRRQQAELFFRQGDIDSGLEAVEEVLYWQPLNLSAYEWAQSLVWDTAEKQRLTGRKTAFRLYAWVKSVPLKIEAKVSNLTPAERSLWKNSRSFLPSEHIRLLANFARQRQLTQPSPAT